MEFKFFVQGDVNSKRVFLTSGFQLPFQEEDLVSQIDNAALFQGFSSGGSILHLFTSENLEANAQIQLVKSIFYNFPVYYITKTPYLTTCNSCNHKMVGRYNKCEKCGSDDVTLWSRPIGYFRPVMRKSVSSDFKNAEYKFWLDGRIEDFSTRKEVTKSDIENILNEISEG